MTNDQYADWLGCEAPWVVDGIEGIGCDAAGTETVTFEGEPLLACHECAAHLSDFEQYHAERAITTGAVT